ncbi:MAG: hypothetical protein AAF518_27865, partial [Spirochaetota bacterium]
LNFPYSNLINFARISANILKGCIEKLTARPKTCLFLCKRQVARTCNFVNNGIAIFTKKIATSFRIARLFDKKVYRQIPLSVQALVIVLHVEFLCRELEIY